MLAADRLSAMERNRLLKFQNDIRYYDGLIARNLLSEDAQSWLPLPDIGYRPLIIPYYRTWEVAVPEADNATGKPITVRWHVVVAGYILRVRDYIDRLERQMPPGNCDGGDAAGMATTEGRR